MPDLKVLVGGRNYNVSCNPGEEAATEESAKLLDQEAELLMGQVGRLSEDKILLLSGLLLGDKIRALKHERSALDETLRMMQEKLNELSLRTDGILADNPGEQPKLSSEGLENITYDDQTLSLQNISDMLDSIIKEISQPNSSQDQHSESNSNGNDTQDSFL